MDLCACPSLNSSLCIRIRYPLLQDEPEAREECECSCHHGDRNENGEDWIDIGMMDSLRLLHQDVTRIVSLKTCAVCGVAYPSEANARDCEDDHRENDADREALRRHVPPESAT
jgi:hypothetical protein